MPLKDIVDSWSLQGIQLSLEYVSRKGMLQVFKTFRVKMRGEVVDHLIEVAFKHLFELVQRKAGPVVCDAVLRKVIGPDPLRPVA